ncbi:MAG: HD domain-containing protein [Thermoguttaceae bacterium]
MKNYFEGEDLSLDAIHGYIPICSPRSKIEVCERDLIDSAWVQRLRQIYQLQTAWFVYPTAEHSRFQHSLGAMFLASRMIERLYPSLRAEIEADETVESANRLPSRAYLESLLRIAALLHDVGHGPFGHFFDSHYLADFGLTHEILGAEIIRGELGSIIRQIRRNPNGELLEHETLDPDQVALLIVRPDQQQTQDIPKWLRLLRTLFCGLYTVDNMDFVLRDAYMTGFSRRAFDIDRLLHYTFFTDKGLTVHQKGFSSLIQFISVRAELFQSIYFHRTVRAVDLTLAELFEQSKKHLFPLSGIGSSNPIDNLTEYQRLTDRSLLIAVQSWNQSDDPEKRRLAIGWNDFLLRRIPWKLAAETTILFQQGDRESASIFADPTLFEAAVRAKLPKEYRQIEMRVDIARHLHRPWSHLPTANQNFLYDPNRDSVRPLEEEQLFQHLPQSFKICRIYTKEPEYRRMIADSMQQLLSDNGDERTNM